MTKNSRHLVLSANESTWRVDRPIIFLGNWCLRYSRKAIWRNLDYVVAAPYGIDKFQKDDDFAKVLEYEEKFLLLLTEKLNQFHSKNYSKRFWKMVLGNWLRRYISVIINRYGTITQLLKSHNISTVGACSPTNFNPTPIDSLDAVKKFDDDLWNEYVYIVILNRISKNVCIDKYQADPRSDDLNTNYLNIKYELKKTLKNTLNRLGILFMRDDDAFFISTYLNKKVMLVLQLTLRQFPFIRDSKRLKSPPRVKKEIRKFLAESINNKADNDFEHVLKILLFEMLPLCYLENFKIFEEEHKKYRWPKSPKFIFTSNAYDFDEVFKIWAALKSDEGSKIIVGQHGNNYGTHRYFGRFNPEEVTSDKFLTWGWKDGLPQHSPAFIFTVVDGKPQTYDPSGQVLLVELSLANKIFTWDVDYEFMLYFQDQLDFYGLLNKNLRKLLTVKLYRPQDNPLGDELLRWREFDSSVRLESKSSIKKLVANSRLTVFSYDSTGFLELMAQNIPTIAFWRGGYDHLRDSAVPYYQLLVDVGILHFSADSAAQKTNEIWDNVEIWWRSEKVQLARKKFCNNYCRISKNQALDLRNILREHDLIV